MPRQLKKLTVQFISLVKRPANDKPILLKGLPQPNVFEVRKADEVLQRVYGIVYSPGQIDLQGDYADAETIRKAADDFMQHSRQGQVDINHDFVISGAYVAESWIVKQGDPLFPDDVGAWVVAIQVDDQAIWKQLQNDELAGISLAGTAETEPQQKRKGFFSGWFTTADDNEGDMTLEELNAALKKALDERLQPLEKQVADLAKASKPATLEATEGDSLVKQLLDAAKAQPKQADDDKNEKALLEAMQKKLEGFEGRITKAVDEKLAIYSGGSGETGFQSAGELSYEGGAI